MTSSSKKQKSSELILLPRGYLSNSQYDKWHSDRKGYINEYFKGIKNERENDFMTFGKKVALNIEKGEFADDPVIVFASSFLPRAGNAEYEGTTTLNTPYGDIKLLGKFDDFDPEEVKVYEHKTGKTKWTEARVKKHGQLKFYSVICQNEFGKLPTFELNWVETTNIDQDGNPLSAVRPTGHTDTFHCQHTESEVEEMKRKIINTCIEIDREYRAYLKTIETF